MWVTKLLISPVKKKDFLPKNDQIQPEIGIFVYCWLMWCPVGGLVGGCGARAVSRKTHIYFIIAKRCKVLDCDINYKVDSVNNEDHKKDHPMCGESIIVTLPR